MNANTIDKFYIAAVKLQERGTRMIHSIEKECGVEDYYDIDDEVLRTMCMKIDSIRGCVDDFAEYIDNNDL